MRRLLLLLALVATAETSGCKTAEIAVDHQMTGIHLVAKFEAQDRLVASRVGTGAPVVRY